MLFGVASGTSGAWSVSVRSARAQSATEFGEWLPSAASALPIRVSSQRSQNSDSFAFPLCQGGSEDWHAKLAWTI